MTSRVVRFFLALTVVALSAATLSAQGTGRIVGRIIDQGAGTGLTDVQIIIVGTTTGGMSGVDGRYVIQNVPEGTVTLLVRRIGYAPKTVTGLVVIAGKATEMDVTIASADIQLSAVTVTASAERGTVADALDAQRNASNIINAITSEQIGRSPDGDAAQAVQRVSGVTVQDGKYVFVRGLGDRYTTSSLNGARIPSPEPEKKVVPLDLFPSSLIQSVTTSKTFTPDLQGDFSGASVDIKTKEFPANRVVTFSTSFGGGNAVTGRSLGFAPGVGGDLFALGGSNRATPTLLLNTDFDVSPSPEQSNAMANSFRNAWSPRQRPGAGNGSAGFSVGGSDPVLGRNIGYLLSGTYSYNQENRLGLRRGLALPAPDGSALEVDRYDGEMSRSSVLWGGLANFSTLLGTKTRVALNNTYNRTMDNDARVESGYSQNLQIPLDITRLRYVERAIRSSQLAITNEFSDSHRLEYSLTSSGVERKEPDRSEIVYTRDEANPTAAPLWFGGSNEAAVRTFADLSENALEGRADYKFTFSYGDLPRMIKVGALARNVDRTADNRVFSLSATGQGGVDRSLSPEEIFDGRYTSDAGVQSFRVTPLSAGGSYSAEDRLMAGYIMTDYAVSPRWSIITGARFEQSDVSVTSQPTVGAPITTTPSFSDVLPSLAVTVRLSDNQNLRLAASQTLSRPEYRELAPILYREVIGFDNVLGNPDLVRTKIQNYDLRWEWYPTSAEIFSVSLFGKVFDDPIERVYLGTSGTRIVTFQNADGATNYGVELEARKGLGVFGEAFQPFTVFSNLTLMRSQIDLDVTAASITSANRPMVGQSPYVVNGGLTYARDNGASATVLYNRVGRRIQDAGEAPLPDVYEESRDVLDLSLRIPIFSNIGLRFDARNLLDAPYLMTQGDVVRERFTVGRIFALGFTWRN